MDLGVFLTFIGPRDATTMMACSKYLRCIVRRDVAAYKIYHIYLKIKMERWANVALREVCELHVFINRLICNVPVARCQGGVSGIPHWKSIRKPLRLESILCPLCKTRSIGVATYSALGTKMVCSTPYLDFTCVDCSAMGADGWVSDYYHTPMYFFMRIRPSRSIPIMRSQDPVHSY
jgi:hypothetical protein